MKTLKNLRKDKKGFTLIEIVIVLVIIAILAAMLVPSMLGWIDDSKQKTFLSEANSIKTAVESEVVSAYAAGASGTDLNTFPADSGDVKHYANIEKKTGVNVFEKADWTVNTDNKIIYFKYTGSDFNATYAPKGGTGADKDKMIWKVAKN